MIKLDRVKGNKMIDMLLSNNKLLDRGTKNDKERKVLTMKLQKFY